MSAPYDRPASEPGGMECYECGVIFVGAEWHDQCAVCANNGWQPIETAPRDGTRIWGNDKDDAICMFWHDGFDEFVSSFRRMSMAPGYTIDGKAYQDHSPVTHKPTHWMRPKPPVSPNPSPSTGDGQ